jgi:hypothetical protein
MPWTRPSIWWARWSSRSAASARSAGLSIGMGVTPGSQGRS